MQDVAIDTYDEHWPMMTPLRHAASVEGEHMPQLCCSQSVPHPVSWLQLLET